MGQTDLDSSLDDIIKNNKRRNPDSSRGRGRGGSSRGRGSKITSTRRSPSSFSSSLTRAPVRGRGRGRGGASSERFDSRGPSSERFDSRTNKAIAKSKLSLRGRIGRCNGSSSISRIGDRREDTFNTRIETREKIDPASIIITKSVSRVGASKKSPVELPAAMTIQGKKGYGSQQQMYPTGYGNHKQDDYHIEDHQQQQQQQQQQHHHQQKPQQQQQHIMRPTASGQIDTFAGNTIVLICNLDPAATAEDIGETCSQFGPIVSCDILLDQHGRPLSKAEIEFMYHSSAQDCVTKLDNQIADGRVLRAFLKSKATPPAVPRYSSRTVMSNPQGAEYNSPQLNVRYDQTRLSQGNMHSRHYSHYPSQY